MEFNIPHMWSTMSMPVKGTAIFMIIMSIWSVYVIVDRLTTFKAAKNQSFSFVLTLRDALLKRNVDDAIRSAKVHGKSPVAKVVSAGLTAYKQGREAIENHGTDELGDFDVVDSVNRSLERVKERETSGMRKGLGGLASIASAAPFVGLFGTVLGIINAFKLLSGGGGIDQVGPGIAEALISTAFGLLVAIPAAMFFNYFTGRVENMVVDMNDVSSELLDYVLKEGRA